jgi:hypothetical protein
MLCPMNPRGETFERLRPGLGGLSPLRKLRRYQAKAAIGAFGSNSSIEIVDLFGFVLPVYNL